MPEANSWQWLPPALFGFLAGLVPLLVNWISAGAQREIAALQESLKLYGAVHYLSAQSAKYVELGQAIGNAGGAAFSIPEPSRELEQQLGEEHHRTIEVENKYYALVRENNSRARKLIEEHWNQIDLDDQEWFTQFTEDVARTAVERDETGRGSVPGRVPRHLPQIFTFRPEFARRVTGKWEAKRKRLAKLQTSTTAKIVAWGRGARRLLPQSREASLDGGQ